jgi:hypothetical protein
VSLAFTSLFISLAAFHPHCFSSPASFASSHRTLLTLRRQPPHAHHQPYYFSSSPVSLFFSFFRLVELWTQPRLPLARILPHFSPEPSFPSPSSTHDLSSSRLSSHLADSTSNTPVFIMSSKIDNSEHVKFLVTCIKHATGGKVCWAEQGSTHSR